MFYGIPHRLLRRAAHALGAVGHNERSCIYDLSPSNKAEGFWANTLGARGEKEGVRGGKREEVGGRRDSQAPISV